MCFRHKIHFVKWLYNHGILIVPLLQEFINNIFSNFYISFETIFNIVAITFFFFVFPNCFHNYFKTCNGPQRHADFYIFLSYCSASIGPKYNRHFMHSDNLTIITRTPRRLRILLEYARSNSLIEWSNPGVQRQKHSLEPQLSVNPHSETPNGIYVYSFDVQAQECQ